MSGKRKMGQVASSNDQPKKFKNINGYCKKEGLCIKYVRASLSPPLPTDPCPGSKIWIVTCLTWSLIWTCVCFESICNEDRFNVLISFV